MGDREYCVIDGIISGILALRRESTEGPGAHFVLGLVNVARGQSSLI